MTALCWSKTRCWRQRRILCTSLQIWWQDHYGDNNSISRSSVPSHERSQAHTWFQLKPTYLLLMTLRRLVKLSVAVGRYQESSQLQCLQTMWQMLTGMVDNSYFTFLEQWMHSRFYWKINKPNNKKKAKPHTQIQPNKKNSITRFIILNDSQVIFYLGLYSEKTKPFL